MPGDEPQAAANDAAASERATRAVLDVLRGDLMTGSPWLFSRLRSVKWSERALRYSERPHCSTAKVPIPRQGDRYVFLNRTLRFR
jgi:hypothetical protein